MNNENLTLHFKVKDFNAWQTSYNGNEKIARLPASRTGGCSAARMTRTTWSSSRMLRTWQRPALGWARMN